MDSGKAERAQREPFALPIKPDLSDSVDESWLSDFDSERSEYLIRLDVDRSIIDELRAAEFAGHKFDYFVTELAKYGVAVMRGWIRSGQIYQKMRQKNRAIAVAPDGVLKDSDNALELASLTVSDALVHFRSDVLIPGKWDASKGASIRTYFIGQCLIRFSNIYRQWLTETVDRFQRDEFIDLAEAAGGYEHVESRALDLVDVDAALAAVKNSRNREILVLRGAGFTHTEIGVRLGITEKAVEMAVSYEKKRIMKGLTG